MAGGEEMSAKKLCFALAGGDRRQLAAAEALRREGHTVLLCCLERAGELPGLPHLDLREALGRADCALLPLPALDGNGALNAPLSEAAPSAGELLDALRPGSLLLGGRLPPSFLAMAAARERKALDYFAREELKIANAALTAEGALHLALEETEGALLGARCLVVGYGRIGRLLAGRLRALGAEVTASARSPADLAWVRAEGLRPVHTERLEEALPEQGLVFNTVPAPVLGEERLRLLPPGCLVVDLASRPGGVDREAARRLGLRFLWALSLPGEIAPRSAGLAIKETVCALLAERGML